MNTTNRNNSSDWPPGGDGDPGADDVDLSDISADTEAFAEYLDALEPGTEEFKRALREKAAAVSKESSASDLQRAEEALAEEEKVRRALEFKIKQANNTLREHGLSVDDLAGGKEGPAKLNKLNFELTNSSRLEWQNFPLEALPKPLREYATAHAEAMCVNPAMIAVPALSVMAGAIGNTRRVQIKSSWEEPPTLWTVVINPSGTLKSPSMGKALAPAYQEEERLKEIWERELSEWKEQPEDERGPKPNRQRRLANDTTVESVALLHDENPRGLLLYRDELAGWFGSFNQYNRGDSDLQKWIEFYEGRPIEVDRKSSDRPGLFIRDPSISVTGTIQPDVLEDRLDALHFQSGFAARLLMCEPPEQPRRFNDAGVTEDVRQKYRSLIQGLYEIEMPDREEGVLNSDLQLTGEAREIYGEFFDENQRLLEKLKSGPLRAVVAKIEAVAARLGLVHQLAMNPDASKLGHESIIAGIVLARWFRHEVARIYQRHGLSDLGVSRDRRLANQLPEGTFGVQKIADVWDITKRGAYKVRDRLMQQGLVEKEGHGEYRSLAAEGYLDPFQHFEEASS